MKYASITIALLLAFGIGYYFSNPQFCLANCSPAPTSISAPDFNQQVLSGKAYLFDIRTAEEYAIGHIAGAQNHDFYQTAEFTQILTDLDKTKPYLIYCRSGNRSSQALAIMQEAGFTHVTELAGGIVSWQQAGLPLSQ